jgi:hypothetical protein
MRTFSEAKDGDPHFIGNGIETAFGLDYDDLGCKSCHSMLSFNEPDDNICDNCHKIGGIKNVTCVECHGRQLLEIVHGIPDVHRKSSKTTDCMDCHTQREMHGDEAGIANPYVSLSQEGVSDTKCVNCHDEANLSPANHSIHKNTLDCSACHLKTVLTCYNCHLETYMKTGNDTMAKQVKNWMFLVNDENGKVRAGNFQSAVYQNKRFVVFAPYHTHSVTDKPRSCNECHGNAAIQELSSTGKINVAKWDATKKELVTKEGVIPVVDGKLVLEYLNYDLATKTWSSAGSVTDNTQYGFCRPLTAEQIEKLKIKH